MTLETNRKVLLARRPDKAPKLADFELRDGAVPSLGDEQILVENSFLSLDPYMRGRMRGDRHSYAPPYELGEPVGGFTVGTVVDSHDEHYCGGELVVAPVDWQHFSAYDAVAAANVPTDMLHPSYALGALSNTG